MSSYTITLPWPAPGLWQNRPTHWATKARSVRKAKHDAHNMAQAAGLKGKTDPQARLVFAFHPDPRSRADLQNMPATMKAYIDGIADCMGVDDRHFRCAFPETWGERRKGGEVVIIVEIADAPQKTC